MINWTHGQWLRDEPIIEEARRRERSGEGRVHDDGDGDGVWWEPKGHEPRDPFRDLPTPAELAVMREKGQSHD